VWCAVLGCWVGAGEVWAAVGVGWGVGGGDVVEGDGPGAFTEALFLVSAAAVRERGAGCGLEVMIVRSVACQGVGRELRVIG
jgi:hypothetical protein